MLGEIPQPCQDSFLNIFLFNEDCAGGAGEIKPAKKSRSPNDKVLSSGKAGHVFSANGQRPRLREIKKKPY
jgi:hypothetical protein